MLLSKDGWHLRRLQFDARTAPVDDGYGNSVSGEYVSQFEVSGWIKFLKGTETVMAARLEGRSPIIVVVLNSTNCRRIGHEWRVRDLEDGEIYQVKERPRPTGDRQYLEMAAVSGVAA